MKKILLEDAVRQSIYYYPTLYRDRSYELSRIKVLGHYFLSYGTAMEWHPAGFLYYLFGRNKTRKRLPSRFFDRNLFSIKVAKTDLKTVREILGTTFHYIRPPDAFDNTSCGIFFESESKETAKPLVRRFDLNHARFRDIALAPLPPNSNRYRL